MEGVISHETSRPRFILSFMCKASGILYNLKKKKHCENIINTQTYLNYKFSLNLCAIGLHKRSPACTEWRNVLNL